MSEVELGPQPGELWRAYDMTPFGPGAITSVVEVVDIVQGHGDQAVVRYRYVHAMHPIEDGRIRNTRLDLFVDGLAAPCENETDWIRRKSVGPVRPDEEPT